MELEDKLLELRSLVKELKPKLEELRDKLDEKLTFLDWQLKWYNLWMFFLPDKWSRWIYHQCSMTRVKGRLLCKESFR